MDITFLALWGHQARDNKAGQKEDAKGMMMDLSFYHILSACVFLPIYLLYIWKCVFQCHRIHGTGIFTYICHTYLNHSRRSKKRQSHGSLRAKQGLDSSIEVEQITQTSIPQSTTQRRRFEKLCRFEKLPEWLPVHKNPGQHWIDLEWHVEKFPPSESNIWAICLKTAWQSCH